MANIQSFMWRLLNKALATKEALYHRKISSDLLCAVCGNGVETLEHPILLCDWANRAWFACPLNMNVTPFNVTNMCFWIEDLLLNRDPILDHWKAYMATLCWNIKKHRCRFIFEHIIPNPAVVLDITDYDM